MDKFALPVRGSTTTEPPDKRADERAKVVKGCLDAVLSDVMSAYPSLQTVLELEIRAYHSLSSAHVIHLMCVDVPAALSYLDKGLSEGEMSWDDLPVYPGTTATVLSPIVGLCFDHDGRLYTTDADRVFFMRSVFGLLKKVKMDCSPEAVQAVFSDFLAVEDELWDPVLPWGTSRDFVEDSDWRDLKFQKRAGHEAWIPWYLNLVTGILCNFGKEFSHEDLVGKHGPGAVADRGSRDDKYRFESWDTRLESQFPRAYFQWHTGDLEPHLSTITPLPTGETPARLAAVPKTLKGPRLITVEPASYQFIQHGLMEWLRGRMSPLLRSSIDFLSQQPSKDLALAASMGATGVEMSTIDLKSASDRLSCSTVESAFRTNRGLLWALNACRSHLVDVSFFSGKDGDVIPLRKFAGMGSAVTFPVQSIVYACCCYAAVARAMDFLPTGYPKLEKMKGMVRVFGDDIILPTSAVCYLQEILDYLQLKVNVGKSHTKGLFRESCGMDAFAGCSVNPCYIGYLPVDLDNPVKLVSVIEASNNAHLGGLWSLAGYLTSCVPGRVRRRMITTSHVDVGGLSFRTFVKGTTFPGQTYFDLDTQRYLLRAYTLVAGDERVKRGSVIDLLQYFLEGPDRSRESTERMPSCSEFITGWSRRTKPKLRLGWVPAYELER